MFCRNPTCKKNKHLELQRPTPGPLPLPTVVCLRISAEVPKKEGGCCDRVRRNDPKAEAHGIRGRGSLCPQRRARTCRKRELQGSILPNPVEQNTQDTEHVRKKLRRLRGKEEGLAVVKGYCPIAAAQQPVAINVTGAIEVTIAIRAKQNPQSSKQPTIKTVEAMAPGKQGYHHQEAGSKQNNKAWNTCMDFKNCADGTSCTYVNEQGTHMQHFQQLRLWVAQSIIMDFLV